MNRSGFIIPTFDSRAIGQAMPTATKEQLVFASCKKRRRDDDFAANVHQPFAQPPFTGNVFLSGESHDYEPAFHHFVHAQQRKVAPLPMTKRLRVESGENARTCPCPASPATLRQSKATPVALPGREGLQETSANPRTSPGRTSSAGLLSRCHICHRKPTKKSDLDSFADCQGCGLRTCFVCLRQCPGWSPGPGDRMQGLPGSSQGQDAGLDPMEDRRDGLRTGSCKDLGKDDRGQKKQGGGWAAGGHRQVVCSRCCVEKGQDGDVVCLECLPYVEG